MVMFGIKADYTLVVSIAPDYGMLGMGPSSNVKYHFRNCLLFEVIGKWGFD